MLRFVIAILIARVLIKLSEVKFSDRKVSLKQKNRDTCTRICMQYHPALPNLKTLLMRKYHLIQNQP